MTETREPPLVGRAAATVVVELCCLRLHADRADDARCGCGRGPRQLVRGTSGWVETLVRASIEGAVGNAMRVEVVCVVVSVGQPAESCV